MLDTILHTGQKITNGLRKVVTWLVIGFYSYMTLAVLIQVVGRYVFNYSIGWASETATFAQIWMVLLAAGLAMHKNLHVGVDIFTNSLPRKAVKFLSLVIMAACLWFFWQAISGSIHFFEIGKLQSSPALRIPMWIPYLSLPVGLIYFALELILSLLAKWNDSEIKEADIKEAQI